MSDRQRTKQSSKIKYTEIKYSESAAVGLLICTEDSLNRIQILWGHQKNIPFV